jgi:ABC-type glycerol-3-phosphate transport system substrate-binding protein
MLVRFLGSHDEQIRRSHNVNEAPTILEIYSDPAVSAANPQYPRVLEVFRTGAVFRPSRQAGMMYPDVSRAYFETIYAVLSGKKPASKAASDLEGELRQMLKKIPGNLNAASGDDSAQRH